ncbi:MAG: hypothetical protein II220_07780 [Spirochaetales bacterium]|nr:hypothetical protein [Spirochaetales bacterium]
MKRIKDGKYVVTKPIHLFLCDYGELKLSVGKIVTVKNGQCSTEDIPYFSTMFLVESDDKYEKLENVIKELFD